MGTIYTMPEKFLNNIKEKNYMADLTNIIKEGTGKTKRLSIKILLVILAIWLLFKFIIIVDAGETGVYSLFGKVKDKELSSGLHLVIPLAKVTKMSIRTEQYTMSIAKEEGQRLGDDSIMALTREGLEVGLDITVFFHLDEPMASDVYKKVGINYEEKIIRPEIRSAIREIIAQYDARDIYSEKRQEVVHLILNKLQEKINPRGIVTEDIVLRNVQLPANLAKSIQEKLSADQEAQKYDFILKKEEKEAERKRIEAAGQRDAQKIINESLTSEYLNYLYIKELKDRPGTIYVPINPSTGMPMFKNVE